VGVGEGEVGQTKRGDWKLQRRRMLGEYLAGGRLCMGEVTNLKEMISNGESSGVWTMWGEILMKGSPVVFLLASNETVRKVLKDLLLLVKKVLVGRIRSGGRCAGCFVRGELLQNLLR